MKVDLITVLRIDILESPLDCYTLWVPKKRLFPVVTIAVMSKVTSVSGLDDLLLVLSGLNRLHVHCLLKVNIQTKLFGTSLHGFLLCCECSGRSVRQLNIISPWLVIIFRIRNSIRTSSSSNSNNIVNI